KKDEYPVQYATTQNNLGTAYTYLPSATPEERAENVRKAIACYKAALEIYKKDEYPVDFAMTQNNLGTAYTDLPSATAEERADNVKKAIACYKAALEIYKKNEYPQYFCQTAENLGMLLVSIGNTKEGCHWLREAMALKQFLPDRGERLESLIKEFCSDK
ncbi:MAG: tetratricopeptide repeat protein, partial [bacterium]